MGPAGVGPGRGIEQACPGVVFLCLGGSLASDPGREGDLLSEQACCPPDGSKCLSS